MYMFDLTTFLYCNSKFVILS